MIQAYQRVLFGGQSFIHSVVPKIIQTAQEIARLGVSTVIQVDGGITTHTAGLCAQAGATAFVAGNAIFAQPNPLVAAAALRLAISDALSARVPA